jgi:hypothetical protein
VVLIQRNEQILKLGHLVGICIALTLQILRALVVVKVAGANVDVNVVLNIVLMIKMVRMVNVMVMQKLPNTNYLVMEDILAIVLRHVAPMHNFHLINMVPLLDVLDLDEVIRMMIIEVI